MSATTRSRAGLPLRPPAGLGPAHQRSLQQDILRLIDAFNRAGDGTMVVASDYLEVVLRR